MNADALGVLQPVADALDVLQPVANALDVLQPVVPMRLTVRPTACGRTPGKCPRGPVCSRDMRFRRYGTSFFFLKSRHRRDHSVEVVSSVPT